MDQKYVIMVFAMGAVTFVPRWLPLLFLSRRRPPEWLVDWLDFIPVAILSALIFPELFTSGAPKHLVLIDRKILVAVPTFLFALKTRSLGGTVLVGMGLFWMAGKLLPYI